MSDRLAEVRERIVAAQQLGAVVNAMRGMAGARAQHARALIPAIRDYALTAAQAIADTRRSAGAAPPAPTNRDERPVIIVFGAEEGFAGAFTERVVSAAEGAFATSDVFLIGSRATAKLAERGMQPAWSAALPSHPASLPATAMATIDALYAHLARSGASVVALIFPRWQPGRAATVIRRTLLPFDASLIATSGSAQSPLTNLPPGQLIEALVEEYLFAQLCEAAVEAFAAENEARMAAMAAAKSNIDGRLVTLRAEERLVRQETITAEVVELTAGVRARLSTQRRAGTR
ncbi:F0F1 ATP synthase subunit gamma [Hephaestia mangrovi]|uniref:F0F1 ATP synthase subunit gamma n=1 Tax=Hephaestia mangrovi TaxID=2873268 RepID=UPI001CA6DD5E|nr:F0F1 ATP synthase subunit gamma [Hephaestia mangrovi]MBY8826533.1 F0F1 ATP synthase subunit gamma [Hephaestia mangrovi]